MLKKFFTVSLVFIIAISFISCSGNTNKTNNKDALATSNNKVTSDPVFAENEAGNIIGNIINGGYVNQQEDWLYYCNGGYEPICKSKLNGDEKFSYDYFGGSFINIVNDYIFYIAISQACGHELIKMKTDGTDRLKLLDDQCSFLYVKDEWMYYTVMDTGNLFKAKTDGTSITKLSDDYCTFVNVVGDAIYYCNVSDSKKIYKLTNNNKQKINDETCSYLNVVNDWIYFINESNDKKIYRVKIDGGEKAEIIDCKCTSINISGNLIYYTILDDDNIHKAKLDGTEQETIKVNFGTSTPCLAIFENWIYYFSTADGYKICKIKSDGTSKTIF